MDSSWILWVRFNRFEEFDVISKMAELLADSHGSAGHAGWIASNGALMHEFQTFICRQSSVSHDQHGTHVIYTSIYIYVNTYDHI